MTSGNFDMTTCFFPANITETAKKKLPDFVRTVKEFQRTDIARRQMTGNEPSDAELAVKALYLDVATAWMTEREKHPDEVSPEIMELDFELVLFTSGLAGVERIFKSLAVHLSKNTLTDEVKAHYILMIRSNANLLEERDTLSSYIRAMDGNKKRTADTLRKEYEEFLHIQSDNELRHIADLHGLDLTLLRLILKDVRERRIFDTELLDRLTEPFGLGWKKKIEKENAIMRDLGPFLQKNAGEHHIAGLSVFIRQT